MISDQLQETDIFKLILYSSAPFIIWVTWDAGESEILIFNFLLLHADTFLKYQTVSRQNANEDAYIDAKAYLLKTYHHEDISLYEIYITRMFL
jgi:hypothetical protein